MQTKRRRNGQKTYMSKAISRLDRTDLHLLELALANPRISISDLAKAVKMSRPAVGDRIRKLEKDGVVRGWRLELDPARLGLPLLCYVRVKPLQGHMTTIANLAKSLPNVVECHSITGEDCFLVKVCLASMSDLETFTERFHPYAQTVTSIVVSSPVPPRQPPLPVRNG